MKHTQAYCEKEVERAPGQPVNPQAAVAAGLQTMPFLRGSATATVATLGRDDAILRVYNIGDSGLQVWRWDPKGALDPIIPKRRAAPTPVKTGAWRLLFHSESQQTSFNAPLQIAKESQYSNSLEDGVVSTVSVQPGDLVLATVIRGTRAAMQSWKLCFRLLYHVHHFGADGRSSGQSLDSGCSKSSWSIRLRSLWPE